MNEFLTKISGQITGNLILAAFFPVILFLTGLALIVMPITPFWHDMTDLVKNPTAWTQQGEQVLLITLFVLALTVILYNLNIPIVRLYEGYPWQDSLLGRYRKGRQSKHFNAVKQKRERIAKFRLQLRIEQVSDNIDDTIDAQRALAFTMNEQYPPFEDLVLPTRLGNVIRAFEMYSRRRYGASAIALWPRLQGVIDTAYAQGLDAAKTSFDFMLHSAFLSALLGVLLSAAGLWWYNPLIHGFGQRWIGWMIFFVGLSYLLYLAAINRASEWGSQVEAAFDLYRGKLLTQLGYDLKVADLDEERRVWEVLNYQFAYPDDRTYPNVPYRAPDTYLIVYPVATIVTFTRTVSVLEEGSVQVRLAIANTDPTRWDADRVVLRENVPSGFTLLRGSASVDGAPANLLGTNPLQLDLGALPYYQTRVVVYILKPQPRA
jgi:hypothetical protein